MSSHYLRKYGAEAVVNFELYELDGTDLIASAASASGDINLIRDEAGAEQLDADAFVDEGVVYSLVVSIAEMTAKRITIYIIDQSGPKIWLDKVLIIETYGHGSAQHPFDLGTAATAMRGTNNVVIAGPTKTEMDNAIATVIADTEDLQLQVGTDGAGLTDLGGMSTGMKAEVENEVDEALASFAPPTKTEMDAALLVIKQKAAGTYNRETDSLQAIRDRGDSAWTTGAGNGGDATLANQETLIQILTGKWEVTGNQFIIYDTDGVTPLYTYDITQDGVPTEFNPDLRTPV